MAVELAGHVGIADRYHLIAVPRRPNDRQFPQSGPIDLVTALVCGTIMLVYPAPNGIATDVVWREANALGEGSELTCQRT